MVDFKNQQDFTAVLVKLQNAYGRKQHNSSYLRLSMKIKETPRAFTAVGVLTTHYENNQNKNKKTKGNCELSINRTQDSDQAILD